MASSRLDPDARRLVDDVLRSAVEQRASDLHLEPTGGGYELRLRVDGMLETVGRYETAVGRGMVTRLMVMAELLTYRLDVPQEGRLRMMYCGAGSKAGDAGDASPIDLRLAVIPTTHGQRAVVRLPADLTQPRTLDELGLPQPVLAGLRRFADADAGMVVLTGPAGSGKTTTIYALLDAIVRRHPGLSIISLEDPVERDLPGVTQIEVSPFGELTYERALRSVVRQDPQVLVIGEIRDRQTASIAVQAALSGHRLITTMHAATPGGAIARLLEMGVEPYQIASAVYAVVAQRLLRRSNGQGGYHGRVPVAQIAFIDAAVRPLILRLADGAAIDEALEKQATYVRLHQCAADLFEHGLTDEAELSRVLGPEAGT